MRRKQSNPDWRSVSLLRDTVGRLVSIQEEVSALITKINTHIDSVENRDNKEHSYILRKLKRDMEEALPGATVKLCWEDGVITGNVYWAGFEDIAFKKRKTALRNIMEWALHKDEWCYVGRIFGFTPGEDGNITEET